MLCEELGITTGYAIFGHDVTPRQEDLARKILNLSEDEVRLIEEMVQKVGAARASITLTISRNVFGWIASTRRANAMRFSIV